MAKALKIKAKYIEQATASQDIEFKDKYSQFKSSRGFIYRFKNRNKIVKRLTTTAAKKTYDELKPKVKIYFNHIPNPTIFYF